MAYRKTEKVLAQLEAKRNLIVASAVDVVAKRGADGPLIEATASRAGVAVGLLYKYFPDRSELFAAVVAQVLSRDLATMRERAAEEKDPLQALVGALVVLYARYGNPLTRASREISDQPDYEKGMRDELGRMIGAAVDMPPVDVKLAARCVLGAFRGMIAAHGTDSKRASAAVLFALRGIGVPQPQIRKVIASGWGEALAGAI